MAPTTACISGQLRQLIYYHLDNQLLRNALFLAERLVACDPRAQESAYLLALVHYRLGDCSSAFETIKSIGLKGVHLGCSYILAVSALALEKYKDGICALEKSRNLWTSRNSFGKHTHSSRNPYPDAAAIHCLLGKLYTGFDDKKHAISHFEEALKLHPFMWDAFTSLCDLGASVRVPNIFKSTSEMETIWKSNPGQFDAAVIAGSKDTNFSTLAADTTSSRIGPRAVNVVPESSDPFEGTYSKGSGGGFLSAAGLSQKINESSPVNGSGALAISGLSESVAEAVETPPSTSINTHTIPGGRNPGVISAFPIEPPQAPVRRNRTLQGMGVDFSIDGPPRLNRTIVSKRSFKTPVADIGMDAPVTTQTSGMPIGGKRTVSGHVVSTRPTQAEDVGGPQRRSVRLFNQIRPASRSATSAPAVASTNNTLREFRKTRPPAGRVLRTASSVSTVGRAVSGNRKAAEDGMELDQKDLRPQLVQSTSGPVFSRANMVESGKQEEDGFRWILELFRKCGYGYFALSQFQCQEALQIFASLPSLQQNTPWVQARMGRAHYEQGSYAEAEAYYRRVRSMAPTRFEDMEVYSTILWHLKRETDLSFLAHELIDADWHAPQAWCAIGNAWSIARDHEQALRCFKRATQLDARFAYAFTLQGHEHVANEEYDKALSSYRHGIAADRRHYNAYYGIGRVYEKLGQYDKAISHFKAASSINPTNAVLICCIGAVLEKQKSPVLALQYFTKATELAPKSALSRFKKARTLMALGDVKQALQELMVLKDLAPDEAMVHFLLGRLYKSLGEKGLAVRHFTIALNLDPKASQQIKEAIESLENSDDEDEGTSMME